MSDDHVFFIDDAGKRADLAAAIGSDRPEVRLAGRLMATGYANIVRDWVEAEMRRGTNVNDILRVLLLTEVQCCASIVASVCSFTGARNMLSNYKSVLDELFLKHVALVQSSRSART